MPEVHDYSKIVVQHAEIGRRKLGISDTPPASIAVPGERGLPGERGIKGESGDFGVDGAPGAPGPDGLSGLMAVSLTFPAAVTMGAPRVVMIVAGQAELFDPSIEANADKAIGVSENAAVQSDPVSVIFEGLLVSAGSFVADTLYYAGPAGSLITTVPPSGIILKLGYATDVNTLVVNTSTPVIGV